MKNKILIISLILVSFNNLLKAQQDPYVTHYMYNKMMFNPAAVAEKNMFCFSGLSHYQYVGFEDRTMEFYQKDGKPLPANRNVGPKTQFLSFSAPVAFSGKHYGGLGVSFMSDKLGYEINQHIRFDAAGRLPINSESALSIGFEADLYQKGVDGSQLRPLTTGDPSIPTNLVSQMIPNFSAGLFYTNTNSNSAKYNDIWGGISVANLKNAEYSFGPGGSANAITDKHYYLMAGVSILDFLNKPDLILMPSTIIKYNTVTQVELTAMAEYQQKFYGGLAYRSTADAMSVMLGYRFPTGALKGLRIGYSYDLTMSRLLRVSSGSHELQLNYCFTITLPDPPPKKYYTPRHLDRRLEND